MKKYNGEMDRLFQGVDLFEFGMVGIGFKRGGYYGDTRMKNETGKYE